MPVVNMHSAQERAVHQSGQVEAAEGEPRVASPETRWPQFEDLLLNPEKLLQRRCGIGGSDANVILSGDRERILCLWREKREEAEPQDLSQVLPVMLGCWTEAFNRQWFERSSGEKLVDIGAERCCASRAWRRCTLDALVESSGAIWEAKHTNAFATSEEVLQRYMPQLQHNMAVAGTERAILSVIFGNHKYEMIEVGADWLYQLELLEAEEQFWDCVVTGREPVPTKPPPAPRPIGTREVCLEGNNAWAAAAHDWITSREAAKVHAASTALIKSMMDDDVARAFGHGIEAKRSKVGAITVRELGQ